MSLPTVLGAETELFRVLPEDFKGKDGRRGSGGKGTSERPSVIKPYDQVGTVHHGAGDASFFTPHDEDERELERSFPAGDGVPDPRTYDGIMIPPEQIYHIIVAEVHGK